jgi:hypothetical protein
MVHRESLSDQAAPVRKIALEFVVIDTSRVPTRHGSRRMKFIYPKMNIGCRDTVLVIFINASLNDIVVSSDYRNKQYRRRNIANL